MLRVTRMTFSLRGGPLQAVQSSEIPTASDNTRARIGMTVPSPTCDSFLQGALLIVPCYVSKKALSFVQNPQKQGQTRLRSFLASLASVPVLLSLRTMPGSCLSGDLRAAPYLHVKGAVEVLPDRVVARGGDDAGDLFGGTRVFDLELLERFFAAGGVTARARR